MKKLTIFLASGAVIVALAALLFAQNPQTTPQTRPNSNSTLFDTCPWHNGNTGTMMQQSRMGSGMMGNGMMGRGMMSGRMNASMMVDDCNSSMNAMPMNSAMMNSNNSSAGTCPHAAAQFKTWQQSNKISTPLNQDAARQWAEYYVNAYNNPDLVLGKITEKKNGFEIEVRSKKSNKVLEKILVDKQTGWISQVQN